jgi:imidazolonepropionase
MTLLIHASQLITLSGGPRRGMDMNDLKIIEDGAVLYQDGFIAETGTTEALREKHPDEPVLHALHQVVMPGFVDPHTHLLWSGDRAAEFDMRLQGKSYLEIQAAGGGIVSTVRQTRKALADNDLFTGTRSRADRMFKHGTTTVEVKTGYGLDTISELQMLQQIIALDEELPIDLIPTFMPAHAFPPEFTDNTEGYINIIINEMLPLLEEKIGRSNGIPVEITNLFFDVFCEQGAFSLEQTRRLFEAARRAGLPLKIHADEFENLGGVHLAVEMGAVSVDHLMHTSDEEITLLGQSNTVAVALPCTTFGLAEKQYMPARKFIDANAIVALATDCNPGTAWNESMQFVIALACRYMKMTVAEALCAATINAAAAIRCEDRVGSIEPGKQADMIILAASDYRHLGYRFGTNLVQTIIKKGKEDPET